MFIACGFSPAMKLLRRFAPDINTTVAQRLLKTRGQYSNKVSPIIAPTSDYSLLDDTDHRDAVQQRFMLKQVPRMLAMIALAACHMALMLDVRDACFIIPRNSTTILKWMC
jgi:3-oxoacyl-ACP reductase-like protein